MHLAAVLGALATQRREYLQVVPDKAVGHPRCRRRTAAKVVQSPAAVLQVVLRMSMAHIRIRPHVRMQVSEGVHQVAMRERL
eukprot:ctg_2408.g575